MTWRSIGFPSFVAAIVMAAGSVVLSATPATLTETTEGNQIVTEARKVLSEVKQTKYEHKSDIDEPAGKFITDCSGLVSFVMKNIAPEQLAQVMTKRKVHPLAEDYYVTIHGADGTRGWEEVTRFADALPGDVIAYRYDDPKRTNTGHVVIVNDKPAFDGGNLWHVQVIDATTRTHADDTRGEGTSGVGRGTMWFSVDADGHPTGVIRKDPKTETPELHPIAVGRVMPVLDHSPATKKKETPTASATTQPSAGLKTAAKPKWVPLTAAPMCPPRT